MAWLACVYCGLNGWGAAALCFPLISFAILNAHRPLSRAHIFRLLLVAATGVAFDFTAHRFGWIEFPKDTALFPLWLLSMWLLFVALLPFIEFMLNQMTVTVILAAVFGPLSYYSGNAFGVLAMAGNEALVAYAVFWSLFFPIGLYFQKGSQ